MKKPKPRQTHQTPRERKLERVMEAIYAELQNEGVGSSEQLDVIEEFVEGILTINQMKRVLKRVGRWAKGSYL